MKSEDTNKFRSMTKGFNTCSRCKVLFEEVYTAEFKEDYVKEVVRWCPLCGAVTVDVDSTIDGQIYRDTLSTPELLE